VRLVDGLPIRSSGSTSGSLSKDRLSWVIIRCVPGEAGNRAAISICLEQSKDNRPERPHWKLVCLVDGDVVIFALFIIIIILTLLLPSYTQIHLPGHTQRHERRKKEKILPTRIRTRDLEISVVKPSTVSRSAN
jgi:hypothetical protein